MRYPSWFAFVGILLFSMEATAGELRLIDAHMHYWLSSWQAHPPQAVITKMDEAGVSHAVISSIPDEGSATLQALAPERFVVFLTPERQRGDSSWFKKTDLVPYLKDRLGNGSYRGIGEFHLFDPRVVKMARIQRILDMAINQDLIVHSHSGADVVEALFKSRPGLTVIWAHAGMHAPPGEIAQMFARYPNLYADLSIRTKDILVDNESDGGRKLAPGWRQLFEAFPERMMIGSDSYKPSRWRDYKKIIRQQVEWLGLLPPEIAEAVGAGNARRLFGLAGE